jgi:hypothetical protein
VLIIIASHVRHKIVGSVREPGMIQSCPKSRIQLCDAVWRAVKRITKTEKALSLSDRLWCLALVAMRDIVDLGSLASLERK